MNETTAQMRLAAADLEAIGVRFAVVDLRALLNAIDRSSHDRIRASIQTVSERGFARGRDLATDFARLLADDSPDSLE